MIMGNMMLINRFLVGLILSSIFVLSSCDYFRSDSEKFAQAYRRVLINRELHSDSITAHRNMLKILDEEGYNIDEFRRTYMELAKENPDEFMKMLDTMRSSIAKEIIERKKSMNK